jgi:hypothetical protein
MVTSALDFLGDALTWNDTQVPLPLPREHLSLKSEQAKRKLSTYYVARRDHCHKNQPMPRAQQGEDRGEPDVLAATPSGLVIDLERWLQSLSVVIVHEARSQP